MRVAARLGMWAALAGAVAAIGYDVVQLLQLLGAVGSPAADVLIDGFSLCIAPPFLLAVLALRRCAPPERTLWAEAALLFALMYAIFASLMYVCQLGSVIPYGAAGAPPTAFAVSPHSLFWTIDALAYLAMGASAMFGAIALAGIDHARWAARWLTAHAAVTPLVAFVYFYPHFWTAILLVALPWAVTAPGALLALSMCFRGAARATIDEQPLALGMAEIWVVEGADG